jgi:hypothetical protein
MLILHDNCLLLERCQVVRENSEGIEEAVLLILDIIVSGELHRSKILLLNIFFNSDSHFHFQAFMGLVANQFKILVFVLLDLGVFILYLEKGEWVGDTCYLLFQLFDMVAIDVCIPKHMHELSSSQIAYNN